MYYKWIGAGLVTVSCGGFGILTAMTHRNEEATLARLADILTDMESQLRYHLTPLPELCQMASAHTTGKLKQFFLCLSEELTVQTSPEVSGCVHTALGQFPEIPKITREMLLQLGKSLGRFDLEGQIQGLEYVKTECLRNLASFRKDKEQRLRSYQTLGFCAGAALAVLFF